MIPLCIGIASLSINTLIRTVSPQQHGNLIDKLIQNEHGEFYQNIRFSILINVTQGILDVFSRMSLRIVNQKIQGEVQNKLYQKILSQGNAIYIIYIESDYNLYCIIY